MGGVGGASLGSFRLEVPSGLVWVHLFGDQSRPPWEMTKRPRKDRDHGGPLCCCHPHFK